MTAAPIGVRRILFGEDDPALCELFHAALAMEGFAVETCPDGVASLALVARNRPSILVLDAELPPAGGLDVVRQIREKGSLVPVILLAGRTDPRAQKAFRQWPHVEVLAKPFGLQELLNAVARAGQY